MRGRFSLYGSDIRDIFEPIVSEIIYLVKEQIRISGQKSKAVLLVGGFGASIYLGERIREAVADRILVLQPPEAWSAVARGAVLKGLAINSPGMTKVTVQRRKIRRSYGIQLDVPYPRSQHSHLKHQRFWDGQDGCYNVRIMDWFVKRVSLLLPALRPLLTIFYRANLSPKILL